jgi:hypothetical protein
MGHPTTIWHRACLALFIALAISATSRLRADDGEPSAEALLRARGLTKQGKLWILPEEQELRDRLATLKRFDERHREAVTYVDRLLEANRTTLLQLTKLEEAIKKTRDLDNAANPGSSQKKQLDAELKNEEAVIEQLRKLYIPQEKLGVSPPLKPALVDLVNARAEATLKFLAYRDTPDDLPQLYERLRADSSISAAIAALQTSDQLGPRKDLRDVWRAFVEKLDASLLNDTLPVYREGKVYRFAAILNERRPLTFTFGNPGEPTLIPQNLAEAAGLIAAPDSRQIRYRVAEGREVSVQVIRIAQIRLGRNTVKDVEAYILPPEAADVGARISANSLPGYRARVDPAKFQLIVEGTKR